MLNTKKLVDAKMATSKTGILRDIYDSCQEYDHLPNNAPGNVDFLEDLVIWTSEWITDHPPHDSSTNRNRWEALEDLAEQIYREAVDLGVRFLSSPTDLRNISDTSRSYWLEMADEKHRPGYELSAYFQQWKTAGRPDESFWEYLKDHKYSLSFTGTKVKYYRGRKRAAKRRVQFVGSVLQSLHPLREGQLFSTKNLSTAFSGGGWGIFVVDRENNLYIHKHVVGVYHHSTFTGGGAVQAAGEIVVDESGRVRIITAKSGHYRPTVAEMRRLLQIFPEIPPKAVIRPDLADERVVGGVKGYPKFYYVREWKYAAMLGPMGSTLTPLKRGKVQEACPTFARSSEFQTELSKIPL